MNFTPLQKRGQAGPGNLNHSKKEALCYILHHLLRIKAVGLLLMLLVLLPFSLWAQFYPYVQMPLQSGCTLQQGTCVSNQGKNLIGNGSFETLAKPNVYPTTSANVGRENIYGLCKISEICGWFTSNTATPDYFHKSSMPRFMGIPYTGMGGYQNTRNPADSAFVGLGVFARNNYALVDRWREMITQKLPNNYTLKNNKKYYAEFYVNLANSSHCSVESLGMLFTENDPYQGRNDYIQKSTSNGMVDYVPQIINTSGQLRDTVNWMQISGCFKGTGTEKYVTIGLFEPLNSSNRQFFQNPLQTNDSSAYYFIDEAGLFEFPEAYQSQSITISCGTSVILGTCALPVSADASYKWKINGQTVYTTANPTVTPQYTTTYTLEVSVGDCIEISSVTIEVNRPPAVNAGPDVEICHGEQATLTATGGTQYSWTDGINNYNGVSITVDPATTTTYTVTALGATGCINTDQVTVTVNPLPVLNLGPNPTICLGGSVQLQASGGVTYSWSPTSGLNDPAVPDPEASPEVTTTYTVTVTNSNGCTSSASITVNVESACITIGNDIETTDQSLPFTISNVSPAGGTWSDDEEIISSSGEVSPGGIAPGTYPVTYTVTNSCGTLSATINIIISNGNSRFACDRPYFTNPDATHDEHELGDFGVETTISANGGTEIFDGVYFVKGSLVLTDGQFIMKPGTIFYVQSQSNQRICPLYIEGMDTDLTYIMLDGARLQMEGAAMRSVCDRMWGGVILTNGAGINTYASSTSNGTNCINLKSEISDAWVGITTSRRQDDCQVSNGFGNDNKYFITNTDFLNNFYGILDEEKLSAITGEGVTNSLFQTYPARMKVPLDSVDNGFKWFGYRGMMLAGLDFTNLTLERNRFDNLCEGINVSGNNLVIRQNDFTRNYQYGIWTAGNELGSTGGPDEIVIERNNMVLPSAQYNTAYQLHDGPVTGIFTSNDGMQDITIRENTISGSDPNPLESNKLLYGIYNALRSDKHANVSIYENDIRNQDNGIRILFAEQAPAEPVYRNNYLGLNDYAVSVAFNYNQTASAQIKCNTIEMPRQMNTKGIIIEDSAWFDNLGSNSAPNGNKFINIDEGMINNGRNGKFNYYRYNSSEESWNHPLGVTGNTGGTLRPTTLVFNNLSTICRGTSNSTNGISARVQGTSYAAILEMMDSLHYQVGTPADLMHYQAQILDYHHKHNLLSSLHQYVNTLTGHNLAAYNFFALSLMEYYRRERQETQAQALRSDLLAYNPLNHEIKFRIKYFDVMGRLRHKTTLPGYRFTAADSLDLSEVSFSNTSHSELACVYLRSYRPKAGCGSPAPSAQPRIANAAKPKTAKGSLGQSYPNPAAMEATVPYEVNPGVKEAELRIYEIATGRIIQVVRLDVKAQQINLDLKPIKQGVYSYTLIEDGMPTATKKMVVLK